MTVQKQNLKSSNSYRWDSEATVPFFQTAVASQNFLTSSSAGSAEAQITWLQRDLAQSPSSWSDLSSAEWKARAEKVLNDTEAAMASPISDADLQITFCSLNGATYRWSVSAQVFQVVMAADSLNFYLREVAGPEALPLILATEAVALKQMGKWIPVPVESWESAASSAIAAARTSMI